MTTTTNVQQVKVNLMTQQQYDAATKSPNEFYVITDGEYAETFTAICYSTTFSEIQAAYNAGKVVTCVYVNNGETYTLPLVQINSTGAYFGGTAATGTTLYKAYCLSDGTWSFSSPSYQAPLVSGTNIKTVNNTSLLGSGNVAVQPTLVSGTNIKTINSTSLLGSGNISVQATISDLATIRSGASKGATALQNIATGTNSLEIVGTVIACLPATLTNTIIIGNNFGVNSNCSNAILMGSHTGGTCINGSSYSNTFSIITDAKIYKLLDMTTGLIPDERIPQTLQAVSTTSSTITLVDGTSLYKLTPSAATTISFTNSTSASASKAYTFELCIDMSSTVYSITFPNSVVWQEGEIPDLSSTGIYFFAFRTIDGGTTWLGNLQGRW